MKRKFAKSVLLTLLFTFVLAVNAYGAIPEPMANFFVNDFAGVISDEEQDKIIALNEEIAECGAQIVVATVDFTDGKGAPDYALEMFNKWGIGDAGENNGALILLVIGEDDYFTALGTGTEKFISSGDIGVMQAWHMEAYFSEGNYGTGAVDLAYAIGDKVKEHYGISPEVKPESSGENLSHSTNQNISYVKDNAGVISQKTITEIDEINKKLYNQNGGEVTLYTVRTLGSNKISEEAQRIFNGFVSPEHLHNSALILFVIDKDDYYICTGSELYEKMGQSELNNIIDYYTEPGFAAGNYDTAALETARAMADVISKYFDSANYQSNISAPSRTQSNPVVSKGLFSVGLFSILQWVIIIWVIVKIFGRRRRSYIGIPYYPRRRWYYPWTWFRPRWNRPYYPPPRNNPPPRNTFGGGLGGGAGRPPGNSGGGAGRSSGGFFGSSGGGSSSGGGAGRSSWSSSSGGRLSSGSSRSSSSSSRSSSGSRSSGGGGRSSGGGAGRRK